MSKCNEAYRKYLQEHPHTAVGFDHFAYIWNIRGKVDAEICEPIDTPCAEAIEKENEK